MEFKAVKWARRKMRGRPFGWHGKSYVYLPNTETITFVASNEMANWNFKIGASWMFWNKDYAVLTDKDGKVYPLYGFVSKDNKEPLSRPVGHWDGRERVGLPIGMPMTLTLHGRGKVKVTYSGANLIA